MLRFKQLAFVGHVQIYKKKMYLKYLILKFNLKCRRGIMNSILWLACIWIWTWTRFTLLYVI